MTAGIFGASSSAAVGGQFFDVTTYSGNSSARSIVTGLEADLLWFKDRSAPGTQNYLTNSSTTLGNYLVSNNSNEEFNFAGSNLVSINTDGFSLGSGAALNNSGFSYRALSWKVTPQFFDVVLYTGNGANRTIAHSLNTAPKMIIIKDRNDAGTNWAVYNEFNTANPETDFLSLNLTSASADDNTYWNDTLPTSSVFSVGTNSYVNANGKDYVAYLFAEQPGGSSFGSYTGTASNQSVAVGFQPTMLMVKNITDSGNWVMVFAGSLQTLANSSAAETGSNITLAANGFDITGNDDDTNSSGDTYIYIAWRSTL